MFVPLEPGYADKTAHTLVAAQIYYRTVREILENISVANNSPLSEMGTSNGLDVSCSSP